MEDRLKQFPFFKYAAEYWGAHVREKYEFSLKDLVLDFLGQASKLESAVQAMHLPGHCAPRYSQNFPRGVTALHIASSFGLKLIVRMQLEKGADIHMQDYNGWTALHRATENGHEDMVQLLLDNGADPNQKAKYGGTALHRAATRGHVAITQLLMKANADINAEDNYGGTVLHRAAKRGHEEVVILLIDAGANVNKPYNYEVVTRLLIKTGEYIWEMAESSRKYSSTQYNDVRSDAEKWYGGTALHEAAENGYGTVVRSLLQRGADIDAQDNYGGTALHRAAKMGHSGLVRLLLEKGANVNKKYRFETLRDHLPSDENGAHLRLGVREKAKTNDKGTPLHEAARLGHEAVVRLLVEAAGVEINARMRKGRRHFTGQLSTSMRQWPSSFYKEESMSMRVTMVGGCRYT